MADQTQPERVNNILLAAMVIIAAVGIGLAIFTILFLPDRDSTVYLYDIRGVTK